MAKPDKPKKTLKDCIREDEKEMTEYQKGLDVLIGHNLINYDCLFFYRGRVFHVTLTDKNV